MNSEVPDPQPKNVWDPAGLHVRPASHDDAQDLLRWRNDPHTRAMSRHEDFINESDHCSWFAKVLQDPGKVLLIGLIGERSIGSARFDLMEPGVWEVNVALAPEARGQRLSCPFLAMALQYLYAKREVTTVLAEIKSCNEPSVRLFTGLGFKQQGRQSGFERLALHNT